MPSNLETLELTISSNSTSAKEGIETLVNSLSSLSSHVDKSCTGLKELNAELKKLKSFGGIKLPNLSKVTGINALNKTANGKKNSVVEDIKNNFPTAQQIKEANEAYEEQRKAQALPGEAFKAQLKVQNELYKRQVEQRKAFAETARAAKMSSSAVKEVTEASKGTGVETAKTSNTLKTLKQGLSNATKGAGQFFSRVKRIATTMLIRSAIRAMIKDIKEGINNVYEWSKVNKGEFASSLDSLKNKSGELKNSFGAAISPVIQAAIPLINSLASAAINALNWVNQLISILTGKGSWTKATEGVHDYTDAVNKAGGAASKWIAKFDELNVMTSGGGGGGGAAKVDYSDMFEEVTRFDDEIKEIADYLKDNAESIKAMAVATGVAILGWKLSNAFAETLPMLSKIAGLIGVGAVIAITLQANWSLTNQYLNTGKEGWLIASLLTTAIGTAGASLIASQIFHGNAAVWTASFTLAVTAISDVIALIGNTDVKAFSKKSLLTSIKAGLEAGGAAGIALHFIGGLGGMPLLVAAGGVALFTFVVAIGLKLLTSNNNIKWGSIELTEKQIQTFVAEKMFVASPHVQINLISSNIEEGDVHKTEIEEILTDMIGEMNIINLGLNTAETYGRLKDDVNSLISEVHGYVNNAKETGKLTLQFTPTLVGKDADSQAEWYTNFTTGWDVVDKFYADKGKEIGGLLVENEKGEIIAKNPELLQTLMQQLSDVTNAITQAGIGSDAIAKMKLGLGDLTAASGAEVIKMFKQYKEDLTNAYTDLVNEQYKKQGELVAALGIIDKNSAEYKKALADYEEMGKNLTTAVHDGVASQIEPGKNVVLEWLFGRHGEGSADSINTMFVPQMRNLLSKAGLTAENMKSVIHEILKWNKFDKEELDVMDLVEVSGWQFLSEDIKKQFIECVNIDESTIKELSQIGVSAMELVTFVDWDKVKNMEQNDFVKTIASAYGASGIAAIKHRFPNIKASEILTITDWNAFTTDEQLNFLTALKTAFGSEAALSAAKTAGIDIGKLVKEGMSSKDNGIKTQAEEWGKIIKKGVEGEQPVVKPKVDSPSVTKAKNDIISGVSNLTSWILAKAGWNNGSPNNLKTDVENQKPTVSAGLALKGGTAKAVQDTINNECKPTITATVTATGIADLAKKFKNAFAGTVSIVTEKGTSLGKATISMKAGGGLVDSGDMFVANENGVPEMIGRFGNQAGVANTEQIVTGISRGVAAANESQNNLLREQNRILRGILEKETNVNIGASAVLGRTVKRSLEMLNTATGG